MNMDRLKTLVVSGAFALSGCANKDSDKGTQHPASAEASAEISTSSDSREEFRRLGLTSLVEDSPYKPQPEVLNLTGTVPRENSGIFKAEPKPIRGPEKVQSTSSRRYRIAAAMNHTDASGPLSLIADSDDTEATYATIQGLSDCIDKLPTDIPEITEGETTNGEFGQFKLTEERRVRTYKVNIDGPSGHDGYQVGSTSIRHTIEGVNGSDVGIALRVRDLTPLKTEELDQILAEEEPIMVAEAILKACQATAIANGIDLNEE